ncbi:MAG: LPS export ABC transporter ATP-binding protein [Gammaproteobacteria bacterium]|nr:LPS export ABC transporter ATP-binding protein [Gammaproteobacteria bacterium]
MSRLEARGLVKRYGDRTVVNGISICLERGEVVGLLGPNGAGKTTCFYLLVGLVRCDSGQVLLNRNEVTAMPLHQRARQGLSYLPQEASVFRQLSVEDNILAILEVQPGLDESARRDRLEQLLEELQIGHIRKSKGISLSGGERRRVEIARALVTDPQFILLDEPFAGVDPITVLELQKEIERLRDRGIGVLITDHNVRETLGICTRAYIVNEGRILTEGTAEEILANEQVRRVYLGEHFRL